MVRVYMLVGHVWQGHGRECAWQRGVWQKGVCMAGVGHVWQGGHAWQGGCVHGGSVHGGMHGRGHAWQETGIAGGMHAGETATKVGLMPPTRMHSCFCVKSYYSHSLCPAVKVCPWCGVGLLRLYFL